MEDQTYWLGYRITWFILFGGVWIYGMSRYRPVVGVGVGWLAAAIAATILAVFWPFYVLALLLLAGMLAWRWLWSTNTICHSH